ncbi:MAG TPA: hypothetical protein VLK33_18925 [Terriglobales bacterium]|nr:hypothetical protein [Terriglobales bacterium]
MAGLKMGYALATINFPEEISGFEKARNDFMVSEKPLPVRTVVIDSRNHPELDKLREQLNHSVYVEESNGVIHGVAQFFGSFQCYFVLSNNPTRSYGNGFLGTLDPLTGEEVFCAVPKLDIAKFKGNETVRLLDAVEKFNNDAKARGAKFDPLDVKGNTTHP